MRGKFWPLLVEFYFYFWGVLPQGLASKFGLFSEVAMSGLQYCVLVLAAPEHPNATWVSGKTLILKRPGLRRPRILG